MDLKQHLIRIENHGYYGFTRRVDDFRDNDGNSYTGVIYILSCIWNGNRSEENLIIEELKNGDLIGDPEFAFIEFTFSRALGSLIDRETEDAIDLQHIKSIENETFLFNKLDEYKGLKEVFSIDANDYGKDLLNQFDLNKIKMGLGKQIQFLN